MRELRISSLQWAVGVFCALIGALLLVVPHQFESPVETGLGLNLPWWGSELPPRRWDPRRHRRAQPSYEPSAGPGRALSGGRRAAPDRGYHVQRLRLDRYRHLHGAWSGHAAGAAAGPRFAGRRRRSGPRRGTRTRPTVSPTSRAGRWPRATCWPSSWGWAPAWPVCCCSPSLTTSPSRGDWIRPFLPLYGVAFLTSGAALVYAQLRPNLPSVAWWGVHLYAAAVLFAFLVVLPLPSHEWLDVAYYGGFGLVLVLLPRFRGLPTRSRRRPCGRSSPSRSRPPRPCRSSPWRRWSPTCTSARRRPRRSRCRMRWPQRWHRTSPTTSTCTARRSTAWPRSPACGRWTIRRSAPPARGQALLPRPDPPVGIRRHGRGHGRQRRHPPAEHLAALRVSERPRAHGADGRHVHRPDDGHPDLCFWLALPRRQRPVRGDRR